jgi:hypothetical protein
MKFLLAWLLMIAIWAAIVAAMGLQALAGFVLGVLAVIGTSLAVGLAAASAYDRKRDGDGWEP